MLHEEKRKHSKEQQASNLIASELVKTNKTTVLRGNSRISKKTVESTRILSIALYAVFGEAFKIHIIESYLCGQSWLWSRYGPRVLLRPQAANESSPVTT